jgi:Zn-dependent peptidase ImmA (M78 family)
MLCTYFAIEIIMFAQALTEWHNTMLSLLEELDQHVDMSSNRLGRAMNRVKYILRKEEGIESPKLL